MQTATVLKRLSLVATTVACVTLALADKAPALTVEGSFSQSYNLVDLGSIPQLPPAYAGLTFQTGDPNTLLIGGASGLPQAAIYSVPVKRGTDNRIVGFGTASLVSQATGIGKGGIDAALSYNPQGNVLFYTSYDDNSIGQIKRGSTKPNKQINLGSLGIPSSTGALAFVPPGFPGAGRLKITSYSANLFYDTTITPDGSGTYNINRPTKSIKLDGGLDAITYIKAGNPGFSRDSMLIAEYDTNDVSAYAIDNNGDPILETKRSFIKGISVHGANTASTIAATVDPLTGDVLYSTFFEDQPSPAKIVAVRGFLPPQQVPEPTAGFGTGLVILGMSFWLKKKAKGVVSGD